MRSSIEIGKVSAALVTAQAEIKSVAFDSANEFFHSKYASLGAVIDTVKPVFAKHKLAIVQFPCTDTDSVGVETVILHESGEYISEWVAIPIESIKGLSPAQVAGNYISYLRRYSLASIAALYSEEDTDGEMGDRTQQVQSKPAVQQAKAQPVQQIDGIPVCPKCGGDMWDNRKDKRNPNAPDFKCKNKECGGAVWPERTAEEEWAQIMAIPRPSEQWANFPPVTKKFWLWADKKLHLSNAEVHAALGIDHLDEAEYSLEETGALLMAYKEHKDAAERMESARS